MMPEEWPPLVQMRTHIRRAMGRIPRSKKRGCKVHEVWKHHLFVWGQNDEVGRIAISVNFFHGRESRVRPWLPSHRLGAEIVPPLFSGSAQTRVSSLQERLQGCPLPLCGFHPRRAVVFCAGTTTPQG